MIILLLLNVNKKNLIKRHEQALDYAQKALEDCQNEL